MEPVQFTIRMTIDFFLSLLLFSVFYCGRYFDEDSYPTEVYTKEKEDSFHFDIFVEKIID